jgi:hypothetical protein
MIFSVLCWYELDLSFAERHAEKFFVLSNLSMLDIMLSQSLLSLLRALV